jgi:hypothetical protein
MLPIPSPIRAVAFFDGQNLFHCAKAAFGYNFPNYNPVGLAKTICATKGWQCDGVRFYTGVPDAGDNPFWNHFWVAKGAQMGREGVDVRMALDIIRLAHENKYDVALLFCRDQDLSEVADEIRIMAAEKKRWIKVASAFPCSPAYKVRGINRTDWIKIDRATYDACLDTRDYRPKTP